MIVIDESVSYAEMKKAFAFLKVDENNTPGIILIAEQYPGIPDEEIIKHLLNSHTNFVTTDRVLHNKIVLAHKKSLYISPEGIITNKKLSGIKIPKRGIVPRKTELQDSYEIEKTAIHEALIPDSAKQLKKLRTKRRRIRNHFEGLMNIEKIDVTLSIQPFQANVIIGIKIRVISNVGIKGLDASEIYLMEHKNKDEKMYLCYVLIALIRLLLNSKPTTIYYDPDYIRGDFDANGSTEYSDLLTSLKSNFVDMAFQPVRKGKNIEMLRKKLVQLTRNDVGNEVNMGDIMMIKQKIEAAGHML